MNKYTIYGIYQLEDIINHQVCHRLGAIYFADINAVIAAESEEACMNYLTKYLAKMVVMKFSMRYNTMEYDFQELTYKFTSIEPVDDTVGGIIKLSVVYEYYGCHINLKLITGDTKKYNMFHDVLYTYEQIESLDRDERYNLYTELENDGFDCKEYEHDE